jgi:hypothetical protein
MRKHFSRIAIVSLLLAVVGLGYVTYVQNTIIMRQRALIVEMYNFIVDGCPVEH